MIRSVLFSAVLLLLLSGCYRPWVVVRSGQGSSRSDGVSVNAVLVDRLTTASLVQKKVRQDSPKEYRSHPFLSLFRIELILPAAPGGLYHIRPGRWRAEIGGKPVPLYTPASIIRKFRPGLYRSRDYAKLLSARIRCGKKDYANVRSYPVLPALPGETVVVGVLVPRVPYRTKTLTFFLYLDRRGADGDRRITFRIPVPVSIRKG